MENINNEMNNVMLNKNTQLASEQQQQPAPFVQAGGPSSVSIPTAPVISKNLNQHNTTINGKNLRLRDWGRVSDEGFSGFDRALYYRRLPFERNVVMEELRAKHQPLNTQPAPNSARRSVPSGTFAPLSTPPYTGLPMTGGSPMMTTAPILSAPILSAPILSTPILSAPTPILSAPTAVLATTVPVPMLNPPINDGRRYQKLFKQNTGSNPLSKIKSRGTRTDHLVQPVQPLSLPLPLSSTYVQQPVVVTQPLSPTYIQPLSYATQEPIIMNTVPLTTTALPLAGTMPLPAQQKGFMHRRAQQATKDQPQPVYSNIVQTGVPMM